MKHQRHHLRLIVTLAMSLAGGAVLFGSVESAQACPNCKEALPDSDDAQKQGKPDVAKGFAISVVFMIAVPFAMIAAGGGAMWWLSKRANTLAVNTQPQPQQHQPDQAQQPSQTQTSDESKRQPSDTPPGE